MADAGRAFYARRERDWVLRFDGAIAYTMAHDVDRFLDHLFAHEHPQAVYVDLNRATAIDSTGIGLLAKLANGMRHAGRGKPVLLSAHPDINELLTSLCLDEVCTLVTSGAAADGAALADGAVVAIPATTPSERDLARTILEAHRLLSALSEENCVAFRPVVEAFARELGEP